MIEKRNRPADEPGGSKVIAATTSSMTPEQSRILHNWIADANHVPADRLAYVAVVEVAEGKYRRRPYLTLAAAQNAVERAEARGVAASVTLCELVPVVGGEVR